jgi:hypothetical protein
VFIVITSIVFSFGLLTIKTSRPTGAAKTKLKLVLLQRSADVDLVLVEALTTHKQIIYFSGARDNVVFCDRKVGYPRCTSDSSLIFSKRYTGFL